MHKLLRNRTLSIMIAILAFMAYALAPQMLCQAQAAASPVPACHQAQSDSATLQQQGGMDGKDHKQHACCKLCVCHPGITALPTALTAQPILYAGKQVLHRAASVAAPVRVFTNKSSPRGPPLHL